MLAENKIALQGADTRCRAFLLCLDLQQDQGSKLTGDEKGNIGKKSVLLDMSHWRIESLIVGKYAF
ncbi:hypothetical protein AYJ08_13205 [Brevibacillus sp. SKDU10]|nr:hypothetical protein AYJ08_13205 [Brevibacillus sp. SKDU10]